MDIYSKYNYVLGIYYRHFTYDVLSDMQTFITGSREYYKEGKMKDEKTGIEKISYNYRFLYLDVIKILKQNIYNICITNIICSI